MLEIESLAAIDHYIWTGTQVEAADHLRLHQSTLSRQLQQARKILASIGIRYDKSIESRFIDEDEILRSQRKIHQIIRFKQAKGLRVQASCWARNLLLQPIPEGWIANKADPSKFNHCNTTSLLDQYIIDAALVSKPEAPASGDTRFAQFHLSNQPLFLLTTKSHVLSNERGLTNSDLSSQTRLGHSGFVSKECREVMEKLDLSLFGRQNETFTSSFEEPPPHARRYGTAMTMLIRPDLERLDYPMAFPAGDILVVKHELGEHPEILKLVNSIKEKMRDFQPKIDGLEVFD